MLSVDEVAARMNRSPEDVYALENAGAMFSVPVQQQGQTMRHFFPSFQLDPSLDGTLLFELIRLYENRNAPMSLLWDFLRSTRNEFGGLTGIQILTTAAPVGPGVQASRVRAIYELDDKERRQYVQDVALEDLSRLYT